MPVRYPLQGGPKPVATDASDDQRWRPKVSSRPPSGTATRLTGTAA
jgi:hypothetical protein